MKVIVVIDEDSNGDVSHDNDDINTVTLAMRIWTVTPTSASMLTPTNTQRCHRASVDHSVEIDVDIDVAADQYPEMPSSQ